MPILGHKSIQFFFDVLPFLLSRLLLLKLTGFGVKPCLFPFAGMEESENIKNYDTVT